MFPILFTWAFLAYICTGLACLFAVRRDRLLLGCVFVLMVLQVWHLLAPVNVLTPFALLTLASVGIYRARDQLPADCISLFANRLRLAMFLLVWVWLAYLALGGGPCLDAGLYHYQTMRWIREYPIVPGLANLHSRLGYNSSWMLWGALTWSLYPLPHHVMAGFLLGAALCKFLDTLLFDESTPAMRLLSAGLVLGILFYVLGTEVHDTANDCPASAMLALGCVELWTIYERRKEPNRMALTRLFLYSACAVTVKLSALPAAFLCSLVALTICIWRFRPMVAMRASWIGAAVAGALLGVWMFRGIILSGYPLFPSTVLACPVSWRVPASQGLFNSSGVTLWARAPGPQCQETAGNWRWLGGWWARVRYDWRVVTPAMLIALLIPLWVFRRRWVVPLMMFPFVAGTVFWFFMGPDPRFLGLTLWCMVAISATALEGVWLTRTIQSVGWSAAMILLCFILAANLDPASVQLPAELPRREIVITPTRTHSGLVVGVPAGGVANSLYAWDAQLPTTPYLSPDLELRGSSLASGFRIRPVTDCYKGATYGN